MGANVASATPASGISAVNIGDTTFWGTTRILTQVITFQPGATSGWHGHGGVTQVMIISGTGTFYSPDCTSQQQPTGSFFIEQPGENHLLRNETTEPLVVVARYILPLGAPPRIDRPAPAGCAVA